MKKEASRGQALQIVARVGTQINWSKIDGERLQTEVIQLTPEEFGKRFTAFLNNSCRLIVGEPKTIKAKSFDPAKFLGRGWTIWRSPADGDGLSGKEDVCLEFLEFDEIELSEFVFKTCLREGETTIDGEEKIRRLNEVSEFVGFGPDVFLGLWDDYQTKNERSALEWLYWNCGVNFMDFPGAILRAPGGRRCVLCLRRSTDGVWDRGCHWLDYQWSAGDNTSAVHAI